MIYFMIIDMNRNFDLIKDFDNLYVVTERFQDSVELEYTPVIIFDNKKDAEDYVNNSKKALTIEPCPAILKHKSPIEKMSYVNIIFDMDSCELKKCTIEHTNNLDVVNEKDINNIYSLGKTLYIKKSCPDDFCSF